MPTVPGRADAGLGTTRVINRWGALAAVSLATVMMLLDFMAVAVALPAVRHSLNASFPQLEWVLEAFVLTLAALVLTAGHITDIVGRRPVFLGGLAVLAIGSVIGGLAQTPLALIGARVVQGIGGALLFATGSVLLTETFREARGAPPSLYGEPSRELPSPPLPYWEARSRPLLAGVGCSG